MHEFIFGFGSWPNNMRSDSRFLIKSYVNQTTNSLDRDGKIIYFKHSGTSSNTQDPPHGKICMYVSDTRVTLIHRTILKSETCKNNIGSATSLRPSVPFRILE
ncbi:hypothetical protein HanIR_Chr05g0252071 [Helianthus annuus]|nr:hypothetical protein HanIR_Chr05g0252071 [Helianthus annuus]